MSGTSLPDPLAGKRHEETSRGIAGMLAHNHTLRFSMIVGFIAMSWFLLLTDSLQILSPAELAHGMVNFMAKYGYIALLFAMIGTIAWILWIEWKGYRTLNSIDEERLDAVEISHPYIPKKSHIIAAVALALTFPLFIWQASAQVVALTEGETLYSAAGEEESENVLYKEARSWQIANDGGGGSMTVTGTAYSDEGVTPLAVYGVNVCVNGGGCGADATDNGGQYTVGSLSMTGGSIITVFLNSGASPFAVTVTLGSGSSMTGVNLYQDHLIVRSDSGSVALTNNHLRIAYIAGGAVAPIYTVDSNNVLQVGSNKELWVWRNDTFEPGARVKTHDLAVSGSLVLGTNGLTVSGSLVTVNGEMSTSTGILLNSTATSETLRIGSGAMNNLTIDNGLMLYWKLDAGTGAGVVPDSTTNRRNGSRVGTGALFSANVPTNRFHNPRSMNFNGSSDYVEAPEVWDGNGDFTASVWFKTSHANGQLIGQYENAAGGNNNNGYWRLQLVSGFVQVIARDTTLTPPQGYTLFSDAATYGNNAWHLAAMTRRGSTIYLYTDGAVTSVATSTLDFSDAGALFRLSFKGMSPKFIGLMDDVRIYNRALATSEVARLASGYQDTGSGTYVLGSALDVNGNLSIVSGILDASSSNYNATIAGNWANYGGFTKRSGTVTFDGTGHQTVSGSTVFNALSATTSVARTIFFDYSARQSASGSMILNGVSGNKLSLRSTRSGSGARIDLDADVTQNANDFRHLDIQDSNAGSGQTLVCHGDTEGCTDSGNNTNWTLTSVNKTWDGGGSDTRCSTAANWSDNTIPTTTSDVVFDTTSTKGVSWDTTCPTTVASLTMAYGYTGTGSLSGTLTVTGNMAINSGALVTVKDASGGLLVGGDFTMNGDGRMKVRRWKTTGGGSGQTIFVRGNITVGTGAQLYADTEGFNTFSGPGAGASAPNYDGGTHGGVGGRYTGNPGTSDDATYGAFTNPTSLGSGGVGTGGGSIMIIAGGTVSVYGRVSADAQSLAADTAGAGGSINITAAVLTGSGTIRANGGTSNAVGGGGGRISLNGVTTDTYRGTLQVNGGFVASGIGRDGTIYLNAGKRSSLTLGGTGNMPTLRLGSDGVNDYTFTAITIQNGGNLHIDGNPSMNSNNGGATTLNVTTLDVQNGGTIVATGFGFAALRGPAPGGFSPYYSGSHGGLGGNYDALSQRGITYGSITNPRYLGSGGPSAKGGGALIISAAGAVTIDGTIIANGAAGGDGSGAGGSINITASTIAGAGTVSANGGGVPTQCGGGGRVAVILTSGTTYGTVAFQAYGGNCSSAQVNGAAGTVYKKASNQTYGDLIIDNNSIETASNIKTAVSFNVTDTTVESVFVKNKAQFRIGTGGTLTISGTGTALLVNTGSTVVNENRLTIGGTGAHIRMGARFFGSGSTSRVIYTGQTNDADAFIGSGSYVHLGFNNAGTAFKLPSRQPNMNMASLTGTAGTLTVTNANTLTVSGSWINRGSFAAGTGTVKLMGSANSYTLSGSSAFNNLTINNGLVGYWKLDEGTGSTVAKDSSGNGHNGTLAGGPTWSNSVPSGLKFNDLRSLHFDGSDDVITVTDSDILDVTNNIITISAWFKQITGDSGYLLDKNVNSDTAHGVYLDNGNVTWYIAGNSDLALTSAYTTGQWNHIVISSDGNTTNGLRLFINGAATFATTRDQTFTANSADITIGNNAPNNLEFTGLIDEVRIYRRALSTSEANRLASGYQDTGSGVYTLGSALDVNGNISIVSGGLDVSSSNYNATVAGNWANYGGFTKRSGTVTFDGTGHQTLSGSTVFNAMSATTSTARTIFFDYSGRQSASGSVTLRGVSGNKLSIRSTRTGSGARVDLDADATQISTDFAQLSVKDANAGSGQTLVCTVFEGCTNNGNNTNWTFGSFNTISGTAYSNEGTTGLSAGKRISVSLNGGAAAGSGLTRNGGFYTATVTGATLTGGTIISIYIDGESEDAATVTLGDGNSMTGMHLYQNRLIVRSDSGSVALTNNHLRIAKNNADDDIRAVYNLDDENVLQVGIDKELLVWAGDTYTPGAPVRTHDLDVRGTLTMESNTLTVSGSLVASSGTFTTDTDILLNARASSETLTLGSNAVQNLVIDPVTSENGLIGWWKFDEEFDFTAADSSGQGNDGTVDVTATWTATTAPIYASNPSALSFLGKQVSIGTTSTYHFNDVEPFTATAWIRPFFSGDEMVIFSRYSPASGGNWSMGIDLDGTVFSERVTAPATRANSSATAMEDTWHQAALRYDGTTLYAYLDGIPGSGVASDAIGSDQSNNTLQFGSRPGGFFGLTQEHGFFGEMDDMRIYNRALSDLEIRRLSAGYQMATANAAGYALGSSLDVNGNFELRNGTLTAGSNAISVEDTWLNYSGTGFVKGTSTVSLDGSGDQTILGATVFHTLSATTNSARTIFLDYLGRQSASGSLILHGIAGNRLSIDSTVTDSAAQIDLDSDAVQSASDIAYLDVQDANAENGQLLVCFTIYEGCVNSGNNTNWDFLPTAGTGTMKGLIWNDEDGDGLHDSGENTGLNAVSVALTGTTGTGGTVNRSTTTASTGLFFFSGSLVSNAAGYTVTVNSNAAPTGYIRTRFNSSGSNVLGTGGVINVRFGYVRQSTISGSVFIDTDEDGDKDAGETSVFSGSSLTLTGETGTGGTLTLTTQSNGSGIYAFRNLPTSSTGFLLVITPPDDYDTTTTDSRTVIIGTGGQVKIRHFGYVLAPVSSSSSSSSSSAGDGGGSRGDGPITVTPTVPDGDGDTDDDGGDREQEEEIGDLRDLLRDVEERRRIRESEQPTEEDAVRTRETIGDWVDYSLGSMLEPIPGIDLAAIARAVNAQIEVTVTISQRDIVQIVTETLGNIQNDADELRVSLQQDLSTAAQIASQNASETAAAIGAQTAELLGAGAEQVVAAAGAIGNAVDATIDLALINTAEALRQLGETGNAIADGIIAVEESIDVIALTTGHTVRDFGILAGMNMQSSAEEMIGDTVAAVQLATDLTVLTLSTIADGTEITIAFIDDQLNGIEAITDTALAGITQTELLTDMFITEIASQITETITETAAEVQIAIETSASEALDATVYGLISFTHTVSDAIQSGGENMRIAYEQMRHGITTREIRQPPPPRQYKTIVRRQDDTILIAELNLSVFDSLGIPVRKTPVVLFSTPKIAVTNDDGIATFHDVETGTHRLEVHITGEKVESRDVIIEPPSNINLEDLERIEAVLPVIQVMVADSSLHAAAPYQLPWLWAIIGALAFGNAAWFGAWIWRKYHLQRIEN